MLSEAIAAELDARDAAPEAARADSIHRGFARQRASLLHGRQAELMQISRWLAGPGGRPLIVYGSPGSGKTCLLSAAIASESFPQRSVVRILGATGGSANAAGLVSDLLASLRPGVPAATTPDQAADDLAHLLAQWPTDDPLTIVIDALDQLDQGGFEGWLGAEISPAVHLLVSVADGDLDRIDAVLPDAERLPLNRLPRADADEALRSWLASAGRTLQHQQHNAVLAAFARSGVPLHLRLLFERARTWSSEEPPPPLASDAAGVLRQLFNDLSAPTSHGAVLVEAALTALVTAREGLSAPELLGVLSADPTVIANFRHRSPDSPPVDELPPILWSRLWFDLEPYLVERDRRGGSTDRPLPS